MIRARHVNVFTASKTAGLASGRVLRLVALLLATLAAAPVSKAQCWLSGIGAPGLNGNASAVLNWDPDGPGPMPAQLVVGGSFSTAGGVTVNNIARWNGSTWTGFGTGMNGSVQALTATPAGDLVAAGSFTTAGGVAANRIARWNGTMWSPLSSGVDDLVNGLTTLNNGDVVAGGRFTTAGGVAVNRIARWDGTAWSALGTGVGGTPPYYVVSLKTLTNGDVIVGGFFSTAGGSPAKSIARWNGSTWAPLGVGIEGVVNALTTMSNGDLIVGGQFTNTGNLGLVVKRIARWNGSVWSAIGSGMDGTGFPLVWAVWTLPQGDLVAAGDFNSAGGTSANNIARWNGTSWSALGSGTDAIVRALTTLNDASLVVAGNFALAGGASASRIARYATSATDPTIQTHPQDIIICSRDPANFSVSAGGLGPLTYQWQWQPAGASTAWVNLAEGDNLEVGGLPVLNAVNVGSPTFTATALAGYTNFAPRSFRCNVTNACGGTTSNAATLTICYANCDCSVSTPLLTANDFQCFLNSFAAAEPYANCDGSAVAPILTANDFQCFLNAYAAGCP